MLASTPAEHLFLARKLLVGNTPTKAILLFLHFILQQDPCPAGPRESREGGAMYVAHDDQPASAHAWLTSGDDISRGRPAGDTACALLKQHRSHSAIDETK